MFNFDFNIYCIGAAVLGLLLGYMFAYSARQQQPNGNEIAALFATVLGGSALTLIQQFQQCTNALPLYVIGVAVGYALYVFVLNRKWTLVQHLQQQHGVSRAPLAPWLAVDPCCSGGHPSNNKLNCCGCNGNKTEPPKTEKEKHAQKND